MSARQITLSCEPQELPLLRATTLSELKRLQETGPREDEIKGAVEAVLSNCTHFPGQKGHAAEMGEAERRRVLDAAGALGSKGRRYACRPPVSSRLAGVKLDCDGGRGTDGVVCSRTCGMQLGAEEP